MEAPELADHQVGAGHSGQNTYITFIMATLVLTCSDPGCNQGEGDPFKTPEMASGNAVVVLQMHTATHLQYKQGKLGRCATKQNV